jgi:hypothetical protein
MMPVDQILSMLIAERDKLTKAIDVLQGAARTVTRMKKTMPATDAEPAPNHIRKRPRWTPAMKRAASVRAKAAYAERMKKAGKKR